MPVTVFQSSAGAQKKEQLMQAALANAVLHLFKDDGFAPTPTTPLATFTAHEANFDGYAAVTIATFAVPFLFGTSWAVENTTRFDFNSGSPLGGGNQIKGAYLVTAAGVLVGYLVFDPTVPMQADGQVCFVTMSDLSAFGQII